MRHWLTILLLCYCTFVYSEKRALVIGIGSYPDIDYGWHTINGDNDVPLMIDVLQCNGFTMGNISTLTNHQATYVNIIQAFNQLIDKTNKGDIVFIHFSGHGQQITDLNGDEIDGKDESWIPYDALQEPTDDYHGERHLLDDELNYYFHKIYKKIGDAGQLIVVTDACHSGTATRDITDSCLIRGTPALFMCTNKSHGKKYPSYPIRWIALSACADEECNRQYKGVHVQNNTSNQDVTICGSLSYSLYLLRHQLSTIPLKELHPVLQKTILQLLSRPQTPQIEIPKSHHHLYLL